MTQSKLTFLEQRLRGAKQRLRDTRGMDLIERKRNHFNYEDVFLVSFPKSGNTWSRFLLTGLYLWNAKRGEAEPNYYNIHTYVPDLHLTTVGDAPSPVPGLPRLLKSHRGYTPNYSRAIYVARDVRDTMISRFHFINRKRTLFTDFDEFLWNEDFGAAAWARHVEGWLQSDTNAQGRLLLVRYEDLQERPAEELQHIGEFLNLRMSEECIEWMIRVADKRRARAIEERFGRPRPAPVPFMRKGTSGQWRETFDETQKSRIEAIAGPAMRLAGYDMEDSRLQTPSKAVARVRGKRQ